VNHRRTLDEDGKPTVSPLDPKEVEQIQSLVREAIGFNKDRGDALNVVNAPFTLEELPKPEPLPMWKDPEIVGLAKSVGAQLGLVLLGLLAIFGVIRPALKKLPARPARPGTTAVVGGDVSLPPPGGPTAALPDPNEATLQMARDNPATVANVVRSWVNT
jgi:flagellar M-ring protein FliF